MATSSISTARLAELAAKIRARNSASPMVSSSAIIPPNSITVDESTPIPTTFISKPSIPQNLAEHTTDKYGNIIQYNTAQSEFIRLAGIEGRSAVLIGAAGTGKTTCQKGVCQALIHSGYAGILQAAGHKHLPQGEVPGIVIVAYTRRAVANIRKNLPADLQANAITIHKLLEYQPVYYEVMDPETGDTKTTMKFEATRNSSNPLPESIRTIIYEESSMLGTDLYKQVQNALQHPVQEIFLGDIQQLPPVFGPAILGFKLLSLPVVELTEVYRQALESPIISLAHRILSAKPIVSSDLGQWKREGQMTLHPWKRKISWEDALHTAGQFFIAALTSGAYIPEEDVILLPFNKAFGTDELNKIIANKLARTKQSITYQIIAGFNKVHLSVGDKVLYDKEDAMVIDISANPTYYGAQPIPASTTLDYWGFDPTIHTTESSVADGDIDLLLNQIASSESGEDRVKKASHIVTLKMLDSDTEVKVESAGDLNSLILGYALTIHKSQGSEWRKVFLVLHQSHNTMVSRELLYTAVTRAREELYVICEPDHFIKGIASQRVKGNTLAEKAEYFKGKVSDGFTLEG
jgi:ATP-dependent exoDNAse (exonuclease V) alpha subunit